MKYMAVINTDDYKDFKFFEDAEGKYLVARDANAKSDEWIALRFAEAERMTKTYELSNEIMKMADVDEEHYMATVNIYVLNNLIKEANKANALAKIRAEIEQMDFDFGDFYDNTITIRKMVLEVIDKYKAESEDEK